MATGRTTPPDPEGTVYGGRRGNVTPPDREGAAFNDGRTGQPLDDEEDRITFSAEPPDDDRLLALGRANYTQGTTWHNLALRDQWDDALRLFHGQHIRGSKYLDASFNNRSKLFRPKTRSVVRRGEAAVASAFFSTQDQLEVEPENVKAPYGRASAAFYKALIGYHLRKTIRWYPTVVGAYQTANVMGACFSKQYWRYEVMKIGEREVTEFDEVTGERRPVVDVDPDSGLPVPRMEVVWGVKKDEPACDLLRPENVLFDPAADFRDPIGTSPFVCIIHFMPAYEVKQRMSLRDTKTGQPVWRQLDGAAIASGRSMAADVTTQLREGTDRPDPNTHMREIQDHDRIEIREFFCRWDGIDWHWFTLGDTYLLTGAAPVHERYAHCRPGERPITMGVVNFEALVSFPHSKVNITAPMQMEANDIANLRIDTLRLSLQPRIKAKAGRVTNPEALRRVDPGEPVMVRDMADLEWDKPPSVDAAAFAEQDRINNDYDELAGNFSASSVMTNRKMNETVGGMKMLSAGATQIGDYEIKNFSESWYGPTVEQLIRLVQHYETDTRRMAIAADTAELAMQYNVTELNDELLDEDLVVKVNVGAGAADPDTRLSRLQQGFGVLAGIAGPIVEAVGPQYLWSPAFHEIAEEVLGLVGYKDAQRFLDFGPPPQPAAEEQTGADPAELQNRLEVEQMRGKSAKDIAKINMAKELLKLMLQGEQDQQGQVRDQQHQAMQGEQDRRFQAGEKERERGFERDENERGRGFEREQTAGAQQHEAALSMLATGEAPQARAKPKAAAKGGANVIPLSPRAQQLAPQPASAAADQTAPTRELILAHRQTRGDVARLAQTMEGIRESVDQMTQAMASFLRASHRAMGDVQAQLDTLTARAKAPRRIVMEGGKGYVEVGNERREITRGRDGALSIR